MPHVWSSRDVDRLDRIALSVDIVRGTSQKLESSEALIEIMARHSSMSGQLFIRDHIINTSVGPHPIDALLVSPGQGDRRLRSHRGARYGGLRGEAV